MPGLVDRIVDLDLRIAEIERRARNRKRTGTITEVNTATGLARVKFLDGFISPWVPWKEIAAGGIKTHIPPTVGEQVDVVSESGDMTDGVIDMSSPSDANPRPATTADMVITKGSVTITVKDDAVTIAGPNLRITADVEIHGDVTITGESLTHNSLNVGSTHVHGGVTPGGSNTSTPA